MAELECRLRAGRLGVRVVFGNATCYLAGICRWMTPDSMISDPQGVMGQLVLGRLQSRQAPA